MARRIIPSDIADFYTYDPDTEFVWEIRYKIDHIAGCVRLAISVASGTISVTSSFLIRAFVTWLTVLHGWSITESNRRK